MSKPDETTRIMQAEYRRGFEAATGAKPDLLDAATLGAAMEQACDALSVHSLSPADAPVLLARLAASKEERP